MSDGQLLGVIQRLEKRHTFADGSTGPAYVVTTPAGGDIVFDADELERTARVE
ncbi:MAG TPA: hypothetical protein VNN07_01135 [Candidatus Tectomicrobia bacterium]|nr:hypothetical protein [Candidatus Tectomicrobia bacterium]